MSLRPRQLYFEHGEPHARVWIIVAIREANGCTKVTLERHDGRRRKIETRDDVIRLDGRELIAMTGTCKLCGCTANRACQGGCWWAAPDVCDSHVSAPATDDARAA